MNHNDFLAKYLCGSVDWDNFAGFQCTDLAKAYAKQVWGINPGSFGGSAKNASQATFPGTKMILPGPGNDLKQGDILIQDAFAGNIYGHVGVIHKADRFGYYLFEQNASTGNGSGMGNDACVVSYYKWSERKILRFFRK